MRKGIAFLTLGIAAKRRTDSGWGSTWSKQEGKSEPNAYVRSPETYKSFLVVIDHNETEKASDL